MGWLSRILLGYVPKSVFNDVIWYCKWPYLQMILFCFASPPILLLKKYNLHFINISLVHLLNLSETSMCSKDSEWILIQPDKPTQSLQNVSLSSDQVCSTLTNSTTCFIPLTCHGPHVGFVHQANLTLYWSAWFYATRTFIDEEEKLVYLKHQVCIGMNSVGQ